MFRDKMSAIKYPKMIDCKRTFRLGYDSCTRTYHDYVWVKRLLCMVAMDTVRFRNYTQYTIRVCCLSRALTSCRGHVTMTTLGKLSCVALVTYEINTRVYTACSRNVCVAVPTRRTTSTSIISVSWLTSSSEAIFKMGIDKRRISGFATFGKSWSCIIQNVEDRYADMVELRTTRKFHRVFPKWNQLTNNVCLMHLIVKEKPDRVYLDSRPYSYCSINMSWHQTYFNLLFHSIIVPSLGYVLCLHFQAVICTRSSTTLSLSNAPQFPLDLK